jgi:succinate dehydrogenase / fumarate reductase iron-sulfur subunit
MAQMATLEVWRGDASGGSLRPYRVPFEEGMVLLDVIHVLQATQAGDLACAGTARPASAARAAEVNGKRG